MTEVTGPHLWKGRVKSKMTAMCFIHYQRDAKFMTYLSQACTTQGHAFAASSGLWRQEWPCSFLAEIGAVFDGSSALLLGQVWVQQYFKDLVRAQVYLHKIIAHPQTTQLL